MVIAKRAVSLSKTYLIIGAFMTLIGLGFLSLSGLVGIAGIVGAPTGSGATPTRTAMPFLVVSFQSLAATLFATPVLMLFVYDKNNGVLEYLLSLGMKQRDIYRQYLKAALTIAAAVVAFDVLIDNVAGLLEGTVGATLELSCLVVAVALAAVSLGTTLMMSFSSLQKQRVGSNQPLGMAIAAVPVVASIYLPLILPPLAFLIDLVLAAVVGAFSLFAYALSGRLISREKLLP